MNVLTGNGFADPATVSFTYPVTTGISYSFTDDLFYEIARYRFVGNGSEPSCITGVMNWAHGTYALNTNGSITMTPFGDGFQQIQDPCAGQSNFVENYNNTELYVMWQIFIDATAGPKLHLFQYDGAPLAPMFRVSATPNMLPTRPLRNVTAPVTANTTNGFTTQNGNLKVGGYLAESGSQNGAKSMWSRTSATVVGAGVLGMAVLSSVV